MSTLSQVVDPSCNDFVLTTLLSFFNLEIGGFLTYFYRHRLEISYIYLLISNGNWLNCKTQESICE